MNSKKAITLLVLASMIMALVPVMPASAALSGVRSHAIVSGAATSAYVATGVYDTNIAVKGLGVTPGSTIELYWNTVGAWDGAQGLLNSSKGKPDGTFEIWFKVPEAKKGDHYLWVRDSSTGATAQVALDGSNDYSFAVTQKLVLDPKAGLIGDTVTAMGYGFPTGVQIQSSLFRFNTTTDLQAAIPVLSPVNPKTNSLGSWTATFEVPANNATGGGSNTVAYGDAAYGVSATDNSTTPNIANATYTVGPAISLSSTEGPAGSVVTITGRGYTSGQWIRTGSVTVAGIGQAYVVSSPVVVGTNGQFSAQIVIPMTGSVALGKKTITVVNGSKTADASYKITGDPGITVTPGYEAQLKPVTITGKNFTKIADTEVKVTIAGTAVGTFKTDGNGEFTGTATIPAIGSGDVAIVAKTAAHYLNASKSNYRVGSMMVSMTPGHAKVGEKVALNGFGFTTTGAWNATLGGKAIVTSGTASSGVVTDTNIYVPQLAPGVYEVYVYDISAKIGVTTTFTVDETTSASTTPAVGPNGYTVKIKGENWKHATATPTFRIYNSTKSVALTVTGAAINAAYGNFSGTFTVPAKTVFSIGAYTINITSGDYSVEVPFSIVSPTLDINPRKSEFGIGDVVNFDVAVSFAKGGSYVKVMDPSGNLFWKSEPWATGDWTEVDTTWYFPYYKQVAVGGNLMQLSESAPLGTWTWKWYDNAHALIDNGTFTVVAATADQVGQQVEDLNQEIVDLAEQLTGVTGEISSVKDDVSDVAAIAEQAVAAAQAAADAVNAVAQTANTASQAADNAADAAEAARDAASGLTTLVYGAIGAALVAALAAIVSLMQISRRIAG